MTINHEILASSEESSFKNRIKHFVTKIAITSDSEDQLVDMIDAFTEKLEELFNDHIKKISKPGDKAQFVLSCAQMEHPVSTPIRKVEDLTPEHLLVKIKQSQNSGASISLSPSLTVELIHVRSDPGWEIDKETYPGSGRSTGVHHHLYFGNFLKKHSVYRIANVGDNTCLARSLIAGMSLLNLEDMKSRFLTSSPEVLAAKKHYRKITDKKFNSNKLMKIKVAELYAAAGVLPGIGGDIEVLERFAAVLGICVKIVSLENLPIAVCYKTASQSPKYIYLCYDRDPKELIGHYDLITNIRGFFSKHFYCQVCDVAYNNVYDHKCADVKDFCYACYNRECHPSGKAPNKCDNCRALFRSEACAKRHLLTGCRVKFWCEKCLKCLSKPKMLDEATGRMRHLNNEEMRARHVCEFYQCTECETEVPNNHLCYIKNKSYNKPNEKLLFFDFETEQSTKEHKVNYVHAKYFKPSKTSTKEFEGEWKEFFFAGSNALKDFFNHLTKQKEYQGYTCIAHNLRGYDGVFVLRTLIENLVTPNVIVKGQKVMRIHIPKCRLVFIDSFNFIPMSLAKMPSAFGLNCGSKGYFPHFYNTPENWNHNGDLPESKYYGESQMSQAERDLFHVWYEDQLSQGVQFNMQIELAKYCAQDVEILAESCLAFRRLLMTEADGCDPFTYVTLASVCNAVYKHMFMPPNSIGRVPSSGYFNSRYSSEAIEWLEYVRLSIPNIKHAGNSRGEKMIGKFHVDGYDEFSKTVYEYYGCFYHGCNRCFDSTVKNPETKKRLIQSKKETLEREHQLKNLGYNIVTMWACHWKQLKSENVELKGIINALEVPRPLNPREAFYGGRTETFRLYSNEPPVSYEDVTSLYPWVNYCMEYPVGHPEIITYDFGNIEEYFGLIKCTVLPPTNLYIPVLPMHAGPNRKLLFPLCKTCAEAFQVEPCRHTDVQRALTGTWFSEEIKLALKKGYVLVKIMCVWHFQEKSSTLFADYVKTFYKKKLLSSKLPFSTKEEVLKYMNEVEQNEGIKIDSPDDFVDNPGLRQLTKLMLNNLWGRFGMQTNLSQSEFIFQFERIVELLNDQTVEVESIRVISEKAVQAVHRKKETDYLATSKDTNIFIAVCTTSWARIRLYKELDKLGERALYCDTDSVIYKQSPIPEENLTIGNFLGEMTNELGEGDEIIEFVSGGPKNYAYRTAKGKFVVKVKGFTLNSTNSPAFSFEKVRNIILHGVRNTNEARTKIHHHKRRKLENHSVRLCFLSEHEKCEDQASALANEHGISVYNPVQIWRSRDWRIFQKPEQKLYSFHFDKRIILTYDFDTLPFGYK